MMKGFLRKHGVPQSAVEDIVSEAWTRGLETFNPSSGLELVQWVWYILEHNLLPQFGRDRKKYDVAELLDDPPDNTAEPVGDTDEQQALISFLRGHLPSDVLRLFNAIEEVTDQTDSQHIYEEVAARLNITMPQCRNMVKKLKRHCSKLRSKYRP
ncbi:MAG: sigma-70 family RNA polymerase sigma factor [Bacteroidetes bacterium]|nr:sigma-70 family RNA polymerase sigma factor [Bacteroidota bacterium]MCW5896735.1 sigma-70 family RNA polymerase sigma factor [Bacteroidota bacterium]